LGHHPAISVTCKKSISAPCLYFQKGFPQLNLNVINSYH
jgi:hypothetical protein